MTKNNCGFGMVETLLTLGALSALSLAIYMALGPASATAQVKREQDNLRDISTATERSFGLLGSFAGVSTSSLMADGLVPARMRDGSNIRTAWGAAADIFPHSVNRANDSFLVVYPLAPAEVCAKLAAVVARDAFDIRVNGVSVMNASGLDLPHAAQACAADGATMEFVYHSGLVAGTAVAAAPLVLAPTPAPLRSPPGPPVSIFVGPASGVGDAGGIAPVVLAPGAAAPPPPPVATPPAAIATTPTTPPGTTTTPLTNIVACLAPAPATQTVFTCNLGQYGSRNQQAVFSCPEAWEAPLMGSWATVSNNCTNCPAPASQNELQENQARSAPCPAGQSGINTWEEDRSRTRSVAYNCPAGTATLPAATFGGWSAYTWSGTRENELDTCAPPGPIAAGCWGNSSARVISPSQHGGACVYGMVCEFLIDTTGQYFISATFTAPYEDWTPIPASSSCLREWWP